MKKNNIIHLGLYFLMTFTLIPSTSTSAQEMELNTDGLYNAEFFDYVFRGHFENLQISRDDIFFLGILNQYLRGSGKYCESTLPDDKVKIMEEVCATERVTRNGYGMEISRSCVEWKWVWTGLYARPDLYNAKMEVEEIHNMSGLSHALSYLTDPNAMGNSIDLVHKAKGLKLDMERIFRMNTCNCDALKRFEENLIRFALDQTSIRMEGASKYSEVKSSGGPSGTQDFNKLVDDLIRDQAKTWMMNRYQSGSISDVDITKNDQGKPRSLRANYRFSGFGGSSSGSVKIVFKDGLPTCMYFWDFPNNCKTPSMSIVAGYAQGNYGI